MRDWWKRLPLHARLRLASAAVLALGLGAAIVLYLAAPPETLDAFGNDPTESKQYLHDLEVYGGKANVLQDEFRRWFEGLWHGRSLAGTVAFLSAFLALVLRAIANAGAPRATKEVVPGLRLVDTDAQKGDQGKR